MNNDLLSQMCSYYYFYTYIQCGYIWHRNKLSRCQLELLVSCSNDEHQTSLKWDRSSHPVAPECRVSDTLRLKYFTVLQLMFCETCSLKLDVPTAWHEGCNVRYRWSRGFCKTVISLPKSTHSICPRLCIFYLKEHFLNLGWFKMKLFVVLFHNFLSFVWRLWNNLSRVRDFKAIDLPT
jgi:hypothetical protein